MRQERNPLTSGQYVGLGALAILGIGGAIAYQKGWFSPKGDGKPFFIAPLRANYGSGYNEEPLPITIDLAKDPGKKIEFVFGLHNPYEEPLSLGYTIKVIYPDGTFQPLTSNRILNAHEDWEDIHVKNPVVIVQKGNYKVQLFIWKEEDLPANRVKSYSNTFSAINGNTGSGHSAFIKVNDIAVDSVPAGVAFTLVTDPAASLTQVNMVVIGDDGIPYIDETARVGLFLSDYAFFDVVGGLSKAQGYTFYGDVGMDSTIFKKFTVTANNPVLTITNPSLKSGERLDFRWSGFTPGATINVSVQGGGGATFRSNDSGMGSEGIIVGEPTGPHTLIATEGIHSAQAVFTITEAPVTVEKVSVAYGNPVSGERMPVTITLHNPGTLSQEYVFEIQVKDTSIWPLSKWWDGDTHFTATLAGGETKAFTITTNVIDSHTGNMLAFQILLIGRDGPWDTGPIMPVQPVHGPHFPAPGVAGQNQQWYWVTWTDLSTGWYDIATFNTILADQNWYPYILAYYGPYSSGAQA